MNFYTTLEILYNILHEIVSVLNWKVSVEVSKNNIHVNIKNKKKQKTQTVKALDLLINL